MINKKFFVYSFLFLLALSFIGGLQSVSANPLDSIKDGFINLVYDNGWESGNLDFSVARFAYFILLTLIIWVVLDYIPFFEKEGLGKTLTPVISFLIAYLAMAYLTPQELYTALLSYSSLGIVLGGALPFLILGFFSIKVHGTGLGGRLLAKFLWFAFLIFLIIRVVTAIINPPAEIDNLTLYLWTYLILIVLGILWIFLVEKWILRAINTEEYLKGKQVSNQNRIDRLIAQNEAANQSLESGRLGRSAQATTVKGIREREREILKIERENSELE